MKVDPRKLSDSEILNNLNKMAAIEKRIESSFIRHVAEVDRRRLYLPRYNSLYDYLIRGLQLSDSTALKRIHVARASHKLPETLTSIEKGEISVSSVAVLAPCLKSEGGKTLLEKAKGKSKRDCELLVRQIDPRADKQDRITLLRVSSPVEDLEVSAKENLKKKNKPLEAARIHVEFSAGARFAKKLKRAQEILRARHPEGRFEDVLESALDEFLKKCDPMEKAKRAAERQEKTKEKSNRDEEKKVERKQDVSTIDPKKRVDVSTTRYIPAAVRHEVYLRDRGQCTFRNPNGEQCCRRDGIEFEHLVPFAKGGKHDPGNIVLMCKEHNLHQAAMAYGHEYIETFRQKN